MVTASKKPLKVAIHRWLHRADSPRDERPLAAFTIHHEIEQPNFENELVFCTCAIKNNGIMVKFWWKCNQMRAGDEKLEIYE